MNAPVHIVVEHFPVEKLPEELRGPFAPDARVTVTIAQEPPTATRRRLQDFIGAGKGAYRSPEHVLQELRDARDDI
jgi:hypothetical protein